MNAIEELYSILVFKLLESIKVFSIENYHVHAYSAEKYSNILDEKKNST